MDPPNSLVMKIIILFWMEDGNLFSILIGYKDFHHNHHWRMESSSSPIGSWKERRPLIGRRDFHKLSLAKGKQSISGVLRVAPWIYDLLLMLKEKTYDLERSFGKKEVLYWKGEVNVMIEHIFSSLKVVFELFVLNSKSLDCNNGLI
jgi:hypothetical protein